MKNEIVMIVAIISMLLILRYFIYVRNCNKLYRDTESVLKEHTRYFNRGSKIKYEDLSSRLQKYITEYEFYNLRTWYDAYHKFKGIPRNDANMKSGNRYGFKNITSFIDNNSKRSVYYNVTFTDTPFGMKIDYISIEIPGLEVE